MTIRGNTEWMKTVEDGWNVLLGTDYQMIINAIRRLESADKRTEVFGRG